MTLDGTVMVWSCGTSDSAGAHGTDRWRRAALCTESRLPCKLNRAPRCLLGVDLKMSPCTGSWRVQHSSGQFHAISCNFMQFVNGSFVSYWFYWFSMVLFLGPAPALPNLGVVPRKCILLRVRFNAKGMKTSVSQHLADSHLTYHFPRRFFSNRNWDFWCVHCKLACFAGSWLYLLYIYCVSMCLALHKSAGYAHSIQPQCRGFMTVEIGARSWRADRTRVEDRPSCACSKSHP